jgi:hypothetical protein
MTEGLNSATIRTFVNVTMYPQYNKNKIIKKTLKKKERKGKDIEGRGE